MKAKISITEQNAEIEASQEEVSEFIKKVIPNFVLESGGILSDTVRFWRWKNQINIIKKVKSIVENSKLDKKQAPLKISSSPESPETLARKNPVPAFFVRQAKWKNLVLFNLKNKFWIVIHEIKKFKTLMNLCK